MFSEALYKHFPEFSLTRLASFRTRFKSNQRKSNMDLDDGLSAERAFCNDLYKIEWHKTQRQAVHAG